jgi:hypothetical protein
LTNGGALSNGESKRSLNVEENEMDKFDESSCLYTTSEKFPRSQYGPASDNGIRVEPITSLSRLCFKRRRALIIEDLPLLLRPTRQVRGASLNQSVSAYSLKFSNLN